MSNTSSLQTNLAAPLGANQQQVPNAALWYSFVATVVIPLTTAFFTGWNAVVNSAKLVVNWVCDLPSYVANLFVAILIGTVGKIWACIFTCLKATAEFFYSLIADLIAGLSWVNKKVFLLTCFPLTLVQSSIDDLRTLLGDKPAEVKSVSVINQVRFVYQEWPSFLLSLEYNWYTVPIACLFWWANVFVITILIQIYFVITCGYCLFLLIWVVIAWLYTIFLNRFFIWRYMKERAWFMEYDAKLRSMSYGIKTGMMIEQLDRKLSKISVHNVEGLNSDKESGLLELDLLNWLQHAGQNYHRDCFQFDTSVATLSKEARVNLFASRCGPNDDPMIINKHLGITQPEADLIKANARLMVVCDGFLVHGREKEFQNRFLYYAVVCKLEKREVDVKLASLYSSLFNRSYNIEVVAILDYLSTALLMTHVNSAARNSHDVVRMWLDSVGAGERLRLQSRVLACHPVVFNCEDGIVSYGNPIFCLMYNYALLKLQLGDTAALRTALRAELTGFRGSAGGLSSQQFSYLLDRVMDWLPTPSF